MIVRRCARHNARESSAVAGRRHGWRSRLLTFCWLFCFTLLQAPVVVQAQEEVTPPSPNAVISLAVNPAAPTDLLVGTLNTPQPSSIYRSTDGGRSWSQAATGLRADISIAALIYDPQNPQLVLAGDGGFGYLFRSTDGGQNWLEVPAFRELIGPNSAVGELYASTSGGTTRFYAGTRFDGVLTSADGGQSWQRLDSGLAGPARRVRDFQEYGGLLYIGTHQGIYLFATATSSWSSVPGFPTNTIVFSLTAHGGSLYAGTGGDGLWRSDDGATWAKVAGFPATTAVYDLLSAGTSLVAATDGGLWSGSGEQWLQATADGNSYASPAYALGGSSGVVYAGTAGDWVLRATDGGLSFGSLATLTALGTSDLPTPIPTVPSTTDPSAQPTAVEAPPSPTPPQPPTQTPISPAPADTPAAPTEAAPAAAETQVATPTETPTPAAVEPIGGGGTDGGILGSLPDISQLPPVVVGAAILLLLVIVVAALSVIRGPKDV